MFSINLFRPYHDMVSVFDRCVCVCVCVVSVAQKGPRKAVLGRGLTSVYWPLKSCPSLDSGPSITYVPRHLAHQLIQNNWGGVLSLSPR